VVVSGWPPPHGYSDGILAAPGRLLFIAGQVAWDEQRRIVGGKDFAAQFDRALANVLTVLDAAGGEPDDLTRLTLYVTDRSLYLAAQQSVGARYRARMGRHFPAMTLLEVAAFLEEGALVEIEATAVIPERR
jgi:enamine deaminase RidA (YjgF/YER057c/UK114 family)